MRASRLRWVALVMAWVLALSGCGDPETPRDTQALTPEFLAEVGKRYASLHGRGEGEKLTMEWVQERLGPGRTTEEPEWFNSKVLVTNHRWVNGELELILGVRDDGSITGYRRVGSAGPARVAPHLRKSNSDS